MRNHSFETGEYYHIYNRGVDKRNIFFDEEDYLRFLQSLEEFNTILPVGSLYENSFLKRKLGGPTAKLVREQNLVNIISYCLNPNHYHLLIQQLAKGGISEFIKRLGGGYTGYFNKKNRRSGVLFQGKFKSAHINSNEYLLHASVYINLNNHVHQLEQRNSHSSWEEYIYKKNIGLCQKDIILSQFTNPSDYKTFALESLPSIIERKALLREFQETLIE